MKLGTILVHLDHSEHFAARVGIAATLARQHDSHLIGLVPTGLYDGVSPAEAIAGKDTDFVAASADFLRARAEGIAHTFRKLIEGAPSISSEVRLVDQPSVDAVVLHAGRPVLVVPRTMCSRELGRNVLIAWDGSREAASVALESLRASAAPVDDSDLQVPQILAWLRRHGIEAKAVQHVDGFADALLSHAAQEEAGLVVMGGYGHTRIRELVLGGVTRGVFERMDVPILMAH